MHRDTQWQRQWQWCVETANGNGEVAMEERQRNGGNWALQLKLKISNAPIVAPTLCADFCIFLLVLPSWYFYQTY